MRRVVLAAVALGALLVVTLSLPAAAVVPIPVATGVHDNGVYVQVQTQRVFVDGVAVGREVVGCRVHVWTTPDGVGETMTSNLGSAVVNPVSFNGSVVYGRAIFSGLAPGDVLTTSNTTPSVSGACPASID